MEQFHEIYAMVERLDKQLNADEYSQWLDKKIKYALIGLGTWHEIKEWGLDISTSYQAHLRLRGEIKKVLTKFVITPEDWQHVHNKITQASERGDISHMLAGRALGELRNPDPSGMDMGMEYFH